ncbi:hypothetical protein, partial [Acetobacter tropicalis]
QAVSSSTIPNQRRRNGITQNTQSQEVFRTLQVIREATMLCGAKIARCSSTMALLPTRIFLAMKGISQFRQDSPYCRMNPRYSFWESSSVKKYGLFKVAAATITIENIKK